jgi:hypothetical protein
MLKTLRFETPSAQVADQSTKILARNDRRRDEGQQDD